MKPLTLLKVCRLNGAVWKANWGCSAEGRGIIISKVRYTLFVNRTNREQNSFFAEQNIVRENGANMLLYTVCCSQSTFAQTYSPLNSFCIRRRDCYLDENPANSIRRKTCSQNMANTYHTLFAVRPYFIVVCE